MTLPGQELVECWDGEMLPESETFLCIRCQQAGLGDVRSRYSTDEMDGPDDVEYPDCISDALCPHCASVENDELREKKERKEAGDAKSKCDD